MTEESRGRVASSPFPSALPTDLALALTLSTSPGPPSTEGVRRHDDDGLRNLNPDERGIRLVHLLLACAAHAAAGDVTRADRCLGLISALSSPSGDTMQRLAARFAAALAARLLRLRFPGLLSALQASAGGGGRVAARLAFARALPYLPFARAVVTGTVLRAARQEGAAVHVVGLGWRNDPGLWAALLLSFGRLRRWPLRLRFTFVGGHDSGGALQSLTSALLKEASLTEMPIRIDAVDTPLRELDPGMLQVDAGEALAVVSVMSLHDVLLDEPHEGGPKEAQAHQFFSRLRSLSPAVVVAVEREADHDSVADSYVAGLHYYSALFDSVDAAAAAGLLAAVERLAVEEMLGREMEEVVGRREGTAQWAERVERAGFKPAAMCRGALDEAKRVVDAYRAEGVGGYGLAADGGRAVIGWHDRPMYSVSQWQC